MARESAKDVRVIDPPANYSVIGKNVSVGFGQSVTKHVQSVGGVTAFSCVCGVRCWLVVFTQVTITHPTRQCS